jgi:hypothetical protein
MAENNSNWHANQYRKQPPINETKHKQHPSGNRDTAKRIKVSISRETIDGIEQILYQHKVVIIFDGRVTTPQATEWIAAYNKEYLSHLFVLFESLIHSLLVILVESITPDHTIQHRIRESPLKAAGRFAAVIKFTPEFNPINPIDFDNQSISRLPKGLPSFFQS